MLLHPHSYAALAGVVLILAATAAPPLSTMLWAMPQQGVVGTTAGAAFAVFDPAAPIIKDTEVTEIGICLKADPLTVKPAVFLEADGVRFDKCRLDFDTGNWKQHQKVKLYPKASFTAGTSNSVFAARLAWQGNAEHGKTQSLTVSRQVAAGRICQANGDPHYMSFDEKHFDFMGMKCYYLMKSPTLVVQARHGPWTNGNPAAAINIGLGLAYGKTAWLIDCMQADPVKRIAQMSPNSDGVDVIKNGDCSDIQFQMSDGAQVKVQIAAGGTPVCYMNIQVVVPACYKGKTQGLCGVYDDNNANDWTKRDGAMAANQDDFGNSWELKPEEDMFAKGYAAAVINELQVQPVTEECKFPPNLDGFGVAPPPANYDPVAVAPNPLPPVTPLPPVAVAAAPKTRDDQPFVDFVTALCKRALTIPGFDKIPGAPTPDKHVEDCVKDCRLGATLDPIDGYRIAYQRLVFTRTSAAMDKFKICEKTGKPRTRSEKELADEASRLGFGNFKCPGGAAPAAGGEYGGAPASCNAKGTCETFGCACAKGFTMFDCSLDLSKEKIPDPPAAPAVAPAGIAAAPPQPAPVPVPAPANEYDEYRRRR